MEFKKKIRCPYCDGRIKFISKDRIEKPTLDGIEYNFVIPSRINMPYCTTCNRSFTVRLKTEGELEVTLEG